MDGLHTKILRYICPQQSLPHLQSKFSILLTKTCLLLEGCHEGLNSWFGRCNLLKMCILPKKLYLFQALPIKLPSHYFKQAGTLFIRFIWAHKRPHLPQHQLSLPKQYGGLALNDVWKNYQATHLGRFIDWWWHYRSELGLN